VLTVTQLGQLSLSSLWGR